MTAPGGEFLRITLTMNGETVIDRVLQGIEERARAPFPGAAPGVVAAFREIVNRAFETQGASTDAGAWAPLAESTQRDRARHGFARSGPVLQRTGALRRALTLGEGAYVRTTATRLQYQLASEPESLKSFGAHQKGVPGRLPRRAMVSFTADQRTQLVHPIRLYITGRDR